MLLPLLFLRLLLLLLLLFLLLQHLPQHTHTTHNTQHTTHTTQTTHPPTHIWSLDRSQPPCRYSNQNAADDMPDVDDPRLAHVPVQFRKQLLQQLAQQTRNPDVNSP